MTTWKNRLSYWIIIIKWVRFDNISNIGNPARYMTEDKMEKIEVYNEP